MALDPVPWLVGGGAVHSPEVVRTAAYVSVAGASGVVNSGDLHVSELDVPGASVRIAPGAFAIENTYASETSQSYVGRAPSSTDVAITATGGTARSDMLIVRIDDPQYGGTTPGDPEVGPYNNFEVLSNVGSTAAAADLPSLVDYPAIALARIDIPISTGTITDAMITDLRELVAPRSKRVQTSYQAASSTLTATVAGGASWPIAAGVNVLIPKWATKVYTRADLGSVYFALADGVGTFWVRMGASTDTPLSSYNNDGATDSTRQTFVAGGELDIPEDLRGTVVNFQIRGRVLSGAGGARPVTDLYSRTFLDLEFVETPTA